ncbi:BON domain-containing protein [Sphaerotilus sp.]|uniref:BON domain-containing protein n=1 Tax=Sphaerotilus sp. TaxID=2093942 RepID=UPI0025F7164D|nr:BON domain-containing protein [Sphaerotilus sp.]
MTPRFNQLLLAAALLTGFAAAQAGTASGATAADVALATRVQTALQQARPFQTKAADVTVTAANGQVQLSGFVGYTSDEVPARAIAAAVPGVQSVTSTLHAWSTATDPNLGLPALTTSAATGPAMSPSDAALATQVKTALLQAAPLQNHGTDVDVTATNGQVNLSGFVGYTTDEAPALAIAAAVPGVQAVTSTLRAWSTETDPNLGVVPVVSSRTEAAPAMSPSDAALAERVKATLLETAPFQEPTVDLVVTARNGRVDLSGWINLDTDELPARAIAARVSGVKGVTSHLHAWAT